MNLKTHTFVRRANEVGAAATEYALIVVLIAVFIIGGVSFFATGVNGLFDDSCHKVADAGGNATC